LSGACPVPPGPSSTVSTDELDQLFDLSQAILSTVREIDRQTHRFLLVLADFDARRGRELGGHTGCPEWLADATGMIEVRGRLTPERGALLMRAIEAASDMLFRDAGGNPVLEALEGAGSAREKERITARRRADALVLLAERALEAGVGQRPEEVRSGASAERYQVFVHVGTGTLRGEPVCGDSCDCTGGHGSRASGAPAAPSANPDRDRSDIDPGIRVSAETSRRLTCDASVVEVSRSPGGELLDFGRRTRTIPPALRR
jgi:hypothetical protein